jgi:hypothetical protein
MKEFYKVYVKVKLNTSNDILFSDTIVVRAEDIKDARDEALMIVWNLLDKGAKVPYCIKDLGEDLVDVIPTFEFFNPPIPIVNSVYNFYFKIEKLRYE